MDRLSTVPSLQSALGQAGYEYRVLPLSATAQALTDLGHGVEHTFPQSMRVR